MKVASLCLVASTASAALLPVDREEALVARLSQRLGLSPEITRQVVAETTNSRDLAATWSWECRLGPNFWGSASMDYPDCAMSAQSPINFPAAEKGYFLTTSASNPVTNIIKPKSAVYTPAMSHGAPVYACTAPGTCGAIVYNGIVYNHVQTHLHGSFINHLLYILKLGIFQIAWLSFVFNMNKQF